MPTNRISKKHNKSLLQEAADLMPKDAKSQAILHERAKQLAKREEKKQEDRNAIPYVRFQLGAEFYGIPYQFIKEVMSKSAITSVPFVPDFIEGVMNRRGMMLTVMNLNKFFYNKMRDPNSIKNEYIFILVKKGLTLGMLVESIEGSDLYDPALMDASLPSKGIIKPEYILGLHQGKTAIINIEAVMTDVLSQLTKEALYK